MYINNMDETPIKGPIMYGIVIFFKSLMLGFETAFRAQQLGVSTRALPYPGDGSSE